MKVLFVGQLFEGSTSRDRMMCLQALGHEVDVFDTSRYFSDSPRLILSIASRLNWGPPLFRLNRTLQQQRLGRASQLDLVWIDKGKWILPDTIAAFRAAGCRILHFTPDPQFVSSQHRSRHVESAIRDFDLVVTTKRYEEEEYRRRGSRRLLVIDQGFAAERHFPYELSEVETKRYSSDVTFIGHAEPWYAEVLRGMVEAGLKVKIWGQNWSRQRYSRGLQSAIQGGPLWGADYGKALSGAGLGLCLLSKSASDQSTTRTFEIPACGTAMLAERTPEHERLFRDNVEAFYFVGAGNAVEQAVLLSRSPDLRQKVAAAGRARCISSRYDNMSRMQEILALLDRTSG